MTSSSAREKAMTNSQIAGKAGEYSERWPTSVQAVRGMSLGLSNTSSKAAPRKGEVPYSEAAERSVLGAVLLDDMAAEYAIAHVRAEDFFIEEHRLLFEAMLWLGERKKPVRWVPLCHALSSLGTIERIDQLAKPSAEVFLVELSQDLMAPMWVGAHCEILRDYSDRREQIERGTQLVKDAYEGKVVKAGWVKL